MYQHNLYSRAIWVVCLLFVFIPGTPVFAARWYEYYQDAEKAAKDGDWVTAIELLKKAIEQEPRSGKNKKAYGTLSIGYFPYLHLGQAYLAIGETEAARQACERAQKEGVTPPNEVAACLAQANLPPTPAATPIPVSTATPVPTPAAVKSPSMPALTAALPGITLTSATPVETAEETLTIEGRADDPQELQNIAVTVRKAEQKGLAITVAVAQTAESQGILIFRAKVPLKIGNNAILIEATNPAGQVVAQKELRVARGRQTPGAIYAVIIGIGKYENPNIPPLRFTLNDAQGLADIFTDARYAGIPQDHIKLLLDHDATAPNIREALGEWLPNQVSAEDTAIIYYSGHGAVDAKNNYWVTYDADIDRLVGTALNNTDISAMLAAIPSKRVITFLDSCYSAATVAQKDRTRSLPTDIPWEKFTGEGRVAISASDGKQLSLELEQYQHGVFTYYLLEGLKGAADKNGDGVIEVDEIWDYVKSQVTEAAKAKNRQTPVMQGLQSAGIPLTFNVLHLKRNKLTTLLQQKQIQSKHYDCAYEMLASDKSNPLLEGLLSGEIKPETFNREFKCDAR